MEFLGNNAAKEAPLTIGIVGGGFAGTAIAAALHKLSEKPLHIILFDKTGSFGLGEAYKTPFPFHLLNVRARDMSALEDESAHFVNWLTAHTEQDEVEKNLPISDQFVSRCLYGRYLNTLLHTIRDDQSKSITLQLETAEVIDAVQGHQGATLTLQDKREIKVDKVILALGNSAPHTLPFPVAADINRIDNPWDYTAPRQIPSDDPVLIVGTGLSMIDTVLTLYHHQHKGNIYAISRHGLLPLPHADVKVPYILMPHSLPTTIRELTAYLREQCETLSANGGDWRSLVNELRLHVPHLWEKMQPRDKKRFMRHLLPYWNIHRHRVHHRLSNLLAEMTAKNQLSVLSGRVQEVQQGKAKIILRHTHVVKEVPCKWVINCIGPAMTMTKSQALMQSLIKRDIAVMDALDLGFVISSNGAIAHPTGKSSSIFYTLGSLRRGTFWESTAVPEIRKQCFELAQHILKT